MNVLIIEDDPTLGNNIKEALDAEHLQAELVFDGLLAERMLRKSGFDCVIMDINLPGKTGFDLCRDFRATDAHTPVLMITAFSELDDKIKGFNCGADDYLTKPFYMRELLIRVKALLKRTRYRSDLEQSTKGLTAADIYINPLKKQVFRQGQEIVLTPREYQILERLCENPGEVVPKQTLIRQIWSTTVDVNTNTIEVYINFLRNKLDKPFGKNTIRTKVGYGYYLDTE